MTEEAQKYQSEFEKCGAFQGNLTALEHRERELRGIIQSTTASDRINDAAFALVEGEEVAEVPEVRAELAEVQSQIAVLQKAIELQRKKVEAADAAWAAEENQAAAPKMAAAAQRVAESLLAASEAVDAFVEVRSSLRRPGARFPMPSVDALRTSVLNSRLNLLLDEFVQNYGVKVRRSARDAALKAQERRHLEEEKRKRNAGGGIEAGPKGVFRYLVGGKKVPMSEPRKQRRRTREQREPVKIAAGPHTISEVPGENTWGIE